MASGENKPTGRAAGLRRAACGTSLGTPRAWRTFSTPSEYRGTCHTPVQQLTGMVPPAPRLSYPLQPHRPFRVAVGQGESVAGEGEADAHRLPDAPVRRFHLEVLVVDHVELAVLVAQANGFLGAAEGCRPGHSNWAA